MGKLRTVFEGRRYVVVVSDRSLEQLAAEGVVIQRGNKYYDKKGREVIVVAKPFSVHPFGTWIQAAAFPFPAGPWPYLWGRYGNGYAGGSIAWLLPPVGGDGTKTTYAWTNYHVADVVQYLRVDGVDYPITKKTYVAPVLYSPWKLAVLIALRDIFHIDMIQYSEYDFAVAAVDGAVEAKATYPREPDLIYFAGNCTSKNEALCLGAALKIPLIEYPDNFDPVDKEYTSVCTLWQYATEGRVLDEGNMVVNYDGRYAYMRNVYLLNFNGPAGIPGCSGSPVWLK